MKRRFWLIPVTLVVTLLCVMLLRLNVPIPSKVVDWPRYSRDTANVARLTDGKFSSPDEVRAFYTDPEANITFEPYLARVPDNPESEAVRILESGFTRRGNPLWTTGEPFDWSYDPQSDRNWRFLMNALDPLESFIAAYESSGDPAYLAVVKNGVFDWIEYNLVENRENDFKWYDMATGIRATRLAFLFHTGVTREELADDELSVLLGAMDMHVEVLSDPRLLSRGNHGLFQMLGLAAICRAAPILESCESGAPYASKTFAEIARAQFTREGVHVEHSSQYHPWAITVIESMVDYGYFNDFDTRFLADAKSQVINYFYPDGSMTLLGDTGRQGICSVRDMHPFAEYVCTGGSDGEQPPLQSRNLMESGYVVVWSDWNERPLREQSYFFFNAAFHSHAHKHADDFSFLWYERGVPILIDSGKYSYEYSTKWRKYVSSTRAHNTLEIDGEDYTTRLRDAFGSALKTFDVVDGTYLVSAEVERAKSGVDHRRIIVVRPKAFLFVIDVVKGEREEHRYRQWFHFHESLRVEQDTSERLRVFDAAGESLISGYLYADAERSSQLVKGQTEPEVQGWVSRVYKQKTANFAVSNEVLQRDALLAAGFATAEASSSIRIDDKTEGKLRFCLSEGEGVSVDVDKVSLEFVSCEGQ